MSDDRIEVPKVVGYVQVGPPDNAISVSKVVAYVWMVPGDPVGEEPQRQAHVHVQYLRN